jgi:two-component system cell cycle sensor histidine kinase/response regulator CckA
MTSFLPPSLGRAVHESPKGPAMDWRGSGRVLVVDDEDPVRTVIERAVTRFGFTSNSAANGPAAIALFEPDPMIYTLVMLDIKLPGMDGLEVMRRLRLARPDVPVILMSGYNKLDVSHSPSEGAVTGFLHKPFTLDSLAKELRAVLEA